MSDTQKFWSRRVISGRVRLTKVKETFLGKFLSFEGRIGRISHYLRIGVLSFMVFSIAFVVASLFKSESNKTFELIIPVSVVALTWPWCCVMAKRLHDLGVSGIWGVLGWGFYWGTYAWFSGAYFWQPHDDIPWPFEILIAIIAVGMLWMMLAPSQKKENEYGKPQSR